MDRSRILKWQTLHSRGLISAGEFANSMFSALASDDDELVDLGTLVAELPEDVQQEVQLLAQRIRENHFIWTPFVIGSGASPADPARLRRLCSALDHEPVKAG